MIHQPSTLFDAFLALNLYSGTPKKKAKTTRAESPPPPTVPDDPYGVSAARRALAADLRDFRLELAQELGPATPTATAPRRRSSLPAERPSHFVAIHESGHAVAATLFSVEVTSVEARRETGTTWLTWPRTKTHRADIIVTACGPYAQMVLAPQQGHEAWGQGRTEDWGHLQQAEERLEAEEGSRAHQIVNDFLDEARQLVRRHAADITLLARRLIDANGDLTGAEVMDQVGHLWGAALYPWERR